MSFFQYFITVVIFSVFYNSCHFFQYGGQSNYPSSTSSTGASSTKPYGGPATSPAGGPYSPYTSSPSGPPGGPPSGPSAGGPGGPGSVPGAPATQAATSQSSSSTSASSSTNQPPAGATQSPPEFSQQSPTPNNPSNASAPPPPSTFPPSGGSYPPPSSASAPPSSMPPSTTSTSSSQPTPPPPASVSSSSTPSTPSPAPPSSTAQYSGSQVRPSSASPVPHLLLLPPLLNPPFPRLHLHSSPSRHSPPHCSRSSSALPSFFQSSLPSPSISTPSSSLLSIPPLFSVSPSPRPVPPAPLLAALWLLSPSSWASWLPPLHVQQCPWVPRARGRLWVRAVPPTPRGVAVRAVQASPRPAPVPWLRSGKVSWIPGPPWCSPSCRTSLEFFFFFKICNLCFKLYVMRNYISCDMCLQFNIFNSIL